MHAESARAGGSYQWSHYFDPSPELLARFESARQSATPDWEAIEPQFTKS
tara:strand:+ start:1193 stop:1342 length:150 start_codon:yes stop_codon:yes gene_type:complete